MLSTPKQIEEVYSSADFDGAENTRRLMAAVIPGSMIAHKTDEVHKAHRRAFAYVRPHLSSPIGWASG